MSEALGENSRNPAKNPFDCLHLKRRLLYDCSSVVRVLCVCETVFCKCIVQILTAVCFIRAILTVGVSITALPVGDAAGGALTLELTPAAAIGRMRVLSGYQGRSHRAINCCQENEKQTVLRSIISCYIKCGHTSLTVDAHY